MHIHGQALGDLIARVAMRDKSAFDRLYAASSSRLFGVVLRVLKDRHDAEEALQDVYVKIWHNAGKFAAGTASAEGWLVTVARNHAIDRLRARRGGKVALDDAPEIADGAPTPETQAVLSGEMSRLDDCLGQLEAVKADCVRSAYVEGHTYEELAARHAVPLNTMRTWLRRSLIRLRDCMDAA